MYINDEIVEAYVRGTIRHILRDDIEDPALVNEWIKDRKQVFDYWEDTRHGLAKVAPLFYRAFIKELMESIDKEFHEASNNEDNPLTKFFFYKKALNDGYTIAVECLHQAFQKTYGGDIKVE